MLDVCKESCEIEVLGCYNVVFLMGYFFFFFFGGGVGREEEDSSQDR